MNDPRDEDAPLQGDMYQQMLVRAQKVMKLTLGALIDRFRSPEYAHMTPEQLDELFKIVVTTWASMLPPPVGDMWDELIISVAYDAHTEKLMAEKKLEEIADQLGWGDTSFTEEDLPPQSLN